MLIKHKVASGEDFAAIMKKYKVTDATLIWNLVDNRALTRKRKTKDKIQPGDVVWVPDPKTKFRLFKYKGKKYCVPEKEWPKFTKAFCKRLEKTVLPRVTTNLSILRNEFVALEKVQKEFTFSAFFSELYSGAQLPERQLFEAEKEYNRFVAAMRKGKLPDIVKQAAVVEGSLKRLSEGLMEYTRKTADAASKALPVLELTKDAGMICAGVVGMAVLVPAGAGFAVVLASGMTVGGYTSMVFSLANEAGHVSAGDKRTGKQIATNVLTDTLVGVGTGGFNVLLGALVFKYVIPRLATWLLNNKTITRFVERILSSKRQWFDKVLKNTVGRVTENYGKKKGSQIVTQSTIVILQRMSTAEVTKILKSLIDTEKKMVADSMFGYLKESKGNESESAAADMCMAQLQKRGIGSKAIEKMIESKSKAIIAEIEAREMKMAA